MKQKSVFVALIDCQKAFDSVNHDKLFNILRKNNVKGNLYKSILSIYSSVKACVKTQDGFSDTCTCPVGVRQGCS